MAITPSFRLPNVMTASKWTTLSQSVWQTLQKARGTRLDDNGTVAPTMTNREALALVMSLRGLAAMTTRGWSIWYLFAASAYGWDERTFSTSDEQAKRLYSADAAVELMLALFRITGDLDTERPTTDARIEFDDGDFADAVVQGDVIKALRDDGADVDIAVVPTPFQGLICRDTKTGRTRPMKPKCDKDGRGPRWFDPALGREIELECDKEGACKPVKPRFGTSNNFIAAIALLAAVAYLFAPAVLSGAVSGAIARPRRAKPRRRRR